MLDKFTEGFKSTEFLAVVIVSALSSWLISRGATADTVLAMTALAMSYVGGRSYVKGQAKKNGS